MKKKHQKKTLVLLLLITLCSQFTSCSEADIPIDRIQTVENLNSEQKLLIEQSKKWYQNRTLKKKSIHTTSTFPGEPDWAKVTVLDLEKIGVKGFEEFVRIPLINYQVNISYTKRMSPYGFRDLLMRKESNNNYILNIIELHPDSDYIEKKEAESGNSTKDIRTLIKNEDFTGYFLVYSYETNKLIFGERRENGIPTTRLQQ